mmetsp:Transcript_17335/g.24337  ORF Transcript_17335/g.24337 Transcript_17335/m.24337 type:complete len:111 (+) Transcript_17335:478-810(+)
MLGYRYAADLQFCRWGFAGSQRLRVHRDTAGVRCDAAAFGSEDGLALEAGAAWHLDDFGSEGHSLRAHCPDLAWNGLRAARAGAVPKERNSPCLKKSLVRTISMYRDLHR